MLLCHCLNWSAQRPCTVAGRDSKLIRNFCISVRLSEQICCWDVEVPSTNNYNKDCEMVKTVKVRYSVRIESVTCVQVVFTKKSCPLKT